MPDTPETRFALNGDVHLAYQVVGEGESAMLLIESWVHHVELAWEPPESARFMRRLASFGRLIPFDRRGTGMSDPVAVDALPDLETQVADAIAVLDAAGSSKRSSSPTAMAGWSACFSPLRTRSGARSSCCPTRLPGRPRILPAIPGGRRPTRSRSSTSASVTGS